MGAEGGRALPTGEAPLLAAGGRVAPGGLWNRPFILLCVAIFLGYTHQALLGPILPLYIETFDGSVVVAGLALAAFSVLSFFARPAVGYWADRWTLPNMLLTGLLVLGGCGLTLAIPSVAAVFVANAIRGVGWAAMNIAGYATVTQVAPPARRGEASGYYSIATNSSSAFGPALALWLVGVPGAGFAGVFALVGGCALLGAVAARLLPPAGPTIVRPPAASPPASGAGRLDTFVDRRVLLASLLLVCMTLTQAASGPFVPLYAREIGVGSAAGYFVATGLVNIFFRPLFGRFLDMGNRGLWVIVGFGLDVAGFVLLMLVSSPALLVLAGVVYGAGAAVANPILLVVAMDRADPKRVARSMATFSAAYQVGNAVGAPLSGLLIERVGYHGMFLGAIAAHGVGIALAAINWRALSKPAAARSGFAH